jgi:anti-anti-sigma factor
MMNLADMDMKVRDGLLLARVAGEIDLSNAGAIRSSLVREMSNDLLGLVLDLTDLTYLDSAGIRVIYELREDLGTRGQEMRLVVPEGSLVSTTLELVDASSVVGYAPNAESALAELSGSPEG